MLALHDALELLADVNPRQSRVVELRYFGWPQHRRDGRGSRDFHVTVMRDWHMARAWLAREAPDRPDRHDVRSLLDPLIPTSAWVGEWPKAELALLPVLLFLAALRVLDKYDLVTRLAALSAVAAGSAGATLCYAFNTFVFQQFPEYQQLPR